MRTKELIHQKLDDIRSFLMPFLPLINSHVVNFICDNQWDSSIPENIKGEFAVQGFENMMRLFWQYQDDQTCLSDDVSNSMLVKHFIEARKMSLTSLPDLCLSLDDLQLKLMSMDKREHKNLKISRLMPEKKCYEVDIMSQIVASMTSATKCSHIVDIGGGKAYLSSNLALQHNLKVLSIDSSKGNTHGAAKRLQKLEKVWDVVKYKAENPYEAKKGKRWKSRKKVPVVESSVNAQIVTETSKNTLFQQKTEFITSSSNLLEMLEEAFPGERFNHVGLVGLHTCGNLAAAHLKIFVENPSIFKFLLNVGCCYHLLQEEFCIDTFGYETKSCPADISDSAFPMSSYLRDEKFFLSRNPRMLATQSPERVLDERTLPTQPLFYRSLLQVLLLKKSGGLDVFPQGVVGRLAVKCQSFHEYAHRAVKRLGLNYTLTNDELDELYTSHYHHYDQINLFFFLRVGLSPVLESLIMLDRLLYLHEKGMENSFITQIFDPVKSPRCYAIVAMKNEES